jgi:hypothetical protein
MGNYARISPHNRLIMTPEEPFFWEILQTTPPPGWKQQVDSDHSGIFVCDAVTGIMRPATHDELDEYVEGGEYDEVLGEENECLSLTL